MSQPNLYPVTVVQGHVTVNGWVTATGVNWLEVVRHTQDQYLVRIWGRGVDDEVDEALNRQPNRMKAHLRRIAVYARSHGRPVPTIDGVFFPRGTWAHGVDTVILAKLMPVLLEKPVYFDNKALRVRL